MNGASSPATWREYASLAGQLETLRRSHLARVAAQESAHDRLLAEVSEIEQSLITQRHQLSSLYEKLDLPAPNLAPPPIAAVDAAEAVAAARTTAEQAAAQLTAIETAARRSPVLPHWPTNLRNAVVYGCTSLAGFLINLTAFVALSGVGQLLVVFLFFAVPFIAYGVGSSLIGVLFTPALGNRPPRTRPLGLAICLAPVLPLCALWGLSWTVGG